MHYATRLEQDVVSLEIKKDVVSLRPLKYLLQRPFGNTLEQKIKDVSSWKIWKFS